jgi:hypothetical protein
MSIMSTVNLTDLNISYFILSIPNDEKLYTVSRSNVMTKWRDIGCKYLYGMTYEDAVANNKIQETQNINCPIDVLKLMGCIQINYISLGSIKGTSRKIYKPLQEVMTEENIKTINALFNVDKMGMFFDTKYMHSSKFGTAIEFTKDMISFGHLPCSPSFSDATVVCHSITMKNTLGNDVTKTVLHIKF